MLASHHLAAIVFAGCIAGSAGCGPLNDPPSAPEVEIQPAEPTDDDDLRCSVVTESTDIDGDPVTYRFSWFLDGAELGVIVAEDPGLVPAAQTLPGEEWECVVVPLDLVMEGPSASASVTITDGVTR